MSEIAKKLVVSARLCHSSVTCQLAELEVLCGLLVCRCQLTGQRSRLAVVSGDGIATSSQVEGGIGRSGKQHATSDPTYESRIQATLNGLCCRQCTKCMFELSLPCLCSQCDLLQVSYANLNDHQLISKKKCNRSSRY